MKARDVLWLVKLIRRLPHSERVDERLDDCAAYVVLYRPYDVTLPPLTWRHVFGLTALPDVWRRELAVHPGLRIVSSRP